MCNEGELLEKFNIQLAPIPLPELTGKMAWVKKEDQAELDETIAYCRSHFNITVKDEELENIAALKIAMKKLAEQYGCNAGAIQCWNALQSEIGIMPCAANSLLNEEGFPVVCETDIHGAITALMCEAAGMDEARTFFATGQCAIRTTKMANCCSTAVRGRYPALAANRPSVIRWHLIIRALWRQRQSMER